MKKTLIAATAISMSALMLTACGDDSDAGSGSDDGTITMGFAQVGAESGWRTANTKSIQDTAEAEGIDLKFTDAQGKQENQIAAIRSYIQQKVDVIAFSPVVETGWDAVLQEAKAADIPVILTDRAVDSEDTSLYKTFIGSDFVVEGEKAGQWLVDNAADSDVNGDGTINVVQLERLRPSTAPRASPTSSRPTRPSRSPRRRPATSPETAASRSWSRSCSPTTASTSSTPTTTTWAWVPSRRSRPQA